MYTITRIYKVPAGSRIQAAERLKEAIAMQTERDFHVIDIIREPVAKPGKGKRIALKRSNGWLGLLRRQLIGKL
jgi:hypothetical protein